MSCWLWANNYVKNSRVGQALNCQKQVATALTASINLSSKKRTILRYTPKGLPEGNPLSPLISVRELLHLLQAVIKAWENRIALTTWVIKASRQST